MTPGIKIRTLLDPERCWKEWVRLESLKKVQDLFESEGLKNPKTMRVPTVSAIEKSAYRWALENQDQSKEDLRRAWSTIGEVLTEEKWKEFLIDKSGLAYFLQNKKREKFMEENDLYG